MTSDNRITNTIGQLGELRELLFVIDQSGEEVPAILLKLARDKAQEIFGAIDSLRTSEYWEELNRLVLSEWDDESEPIEESPFEEEPTLPIVEIEEVLEEISADEEEADDFLPGAADKEEPAFWENVDENEEEEDFYDDEEDFYDEDEEALFGDEKDEATDGAVDAADAPEVLTLDEVLQRKCTQELRKALSLNDKFRFRRELFGNSDVRMNETLALIDAMESYDEAEDYLYGDLGWDVENTEVAEFMKIVQNRFL